MFRCLAVLVVCLPAIVSAGQDSLSLGVEFFRQVVRPTDLVVAVKTLPPGAAGLFLELSKPADRLTLKDESVLLIQPISQFVGPKPILSNGLDVEVLNDKDGVKRTLTANEVSSYVPYEQLALDRITAFFSKEGMDLNDKDRLAAADMALRAVLRFHHGTRTSTAVGPGPWDDLRGQLEERLLKVRRQLFEHLVADAIKTNSASMTSALADFMLDSHPRDVAIRNQARRLWIAEAAETHKKQDWLRLRNQLRRINEEFVYSVKAEPLRQALMAHAQQLVKEDSLEPSLAKLQAAFQFWPRLPGLRDTIATRQKSYSVVYVGVRSLPVFLSPATAWTDSEKQAIELLFEGFVDFDGAGNSQPGLAVPLTASEPGQKRFEVRHDAYWSDGTRVTPADVRHTAQLLRRGDLTGRSGFFAEMVDVPRVDPESFGLSFQTRQTLFDALLPFSFKVLPEHYQGQVLTRADDPKFAKAPVGSGPFSYAGIETQDGRAYAVFRANPNHVRRSDPGRPFVREIRMFPWRTASDLAALPHPVHLVLGIPTDQLDAVSKSKSVVLHSSPTRRVYFLAVNHRKGALTEPALRRALAHAINREKLLTDHFRGGQTNLHGLEVTGAAMAIGSLGRRQGHTEFHWPISGPYPSKSWASCPPPRVPGNPFDLGLARTFARQVLKPGAVVELNLKYPADEPHVGAACKEIAEEIEALAKGAQASVRIKLNGLGPRDMKKAIEQSDFDLAYHHYDHSGASHDVWPLFDPSPDAVRPGGSNYLGYDSDAKLQSLLRSAHSHRSFPALQEITHNIHAHLYEQMPLIPLWQLHSHLAVDPALTTGNIDPLLVFSSAAEWKLQR